MALTVNKRSYRSGRYDAMDSAVIIDAMGARVLYNHIYILLVIYSGRERIVSRDIFAPLELEASDLIVNDRPASQSLNNSAM